MEPLRPKCDLMVSKFAFKCNLYRYTGAGGGRCAGIIVDVFDEHSRVLPLLTQVETLERDKHELSVMCKEKDEVMQRNKRDFEDALAGKDLEVLSLRWGAF